MIQILTSYIQYHKLTANFVFLEISSLTYYHLNLFNKVLGETTVRPWPAMTTFIFIAYNDIYTQDKNKWLTDMCLSMNCRRKMSISTTAKRHE